MKKKISNASLLSDKIIYSIGAPYIMSSYELRFLLDSFPSKESSTIC
jgi:hypothetical protein